MTVGEPPSQPRLDDAIRLVIVKSPDLAGPLVGALDAADVGVWVWVEGEHCLYWSPRVPDLLGFDPPDDVDLLNRFVNAVHPDDRAGVRQLIRGELREEIFLLKFRFLDRTGQYRWIAMRGRIERDHDGALLRQGGTLRDISAEVWLEEEHAAAAARLRQFELLLTDVTADFASRPTDTLDDALTTALERIGRFLGAGYSTLCEISEDNWISVTHSWINPLVARSTPVTTELDGASIAPLLQHLKADQPFVVRAQRELPEGSVEFFSARGVHSFAALPARQSDGTLVVLGIAGGPQQELDWPPDTVPLLRIASSLLAGVLARVRAEANQRLVDRRAQETHKLESLGVLAGGIAHDFNNLLTAILGNASLLRADYGDNEAINGPLEQIEMASRRAAALCRQMLASAGRGRFALLPVDLNALVRDAEPLLRVAVAKKPVLTFQLDDQLPLTLADGAQIRQLLLNLLTNAGEAIGERDGTIVLRTGTTRTDHHDPALIIPHPDLCGRECVSLKVTDTGEGMAAETVARIFDPFFTTKFTGRGLGLAAAAGIVRAHKGALRVASRLGEGATFELLLPAYHGHAAAITTAPAAATGGGTRWQTSGTVLVVDDESGVRELVRNVLERAGLTVLLADDGRQGLDAFKANAQDVRLIVVDMTMPGLNGREVLAEIRKVRGDVPAILMSGYTADDLADGTSTAFLQKPFTPDVLRALVRKIID